jgi:short-subunit dehydrogenase
MELPYAIITSASKGFGKAFASLLAKEGYQLVLVDDEAEQLLLFSETLKQQHAHLSITTVVKRMDRVEAARELFDEMRLRQINIDILINNAADAEQRFFVDSEWRKEESMILSHVLNTTQLTKLFLRDMIERKHGRVLQLTNLAGLYPSPYRAVAGAVNAYLVYLFEGLRLEIPDIDVSLTLFNTEVTDVNYMHIDSPEGLYRRQHASDADVVANAAYQAMLKGKRYEKIEVPFSLADQRREQPAEKRLSRILHDLLEDDNSIQL